MDDIDQINLDAVMKRQRDVERAAHIAGLKEALEIVQTFIDDDGIMYTKHMNSMNIGMAIRARIKELEEGK